MEEIDVASLRVALSDGASESVLAGLWARSLVDHFVSVPHEALASADSFGREAVMVTASWEATLGDYIARREADGRPIQWYEQPKLDRGAYATLLAISFCAPQEGDLADLRGEGRWAAAVIGDCCLFQVRDGALITAYPLAGSEDFGTSPNLLNSRNQDSLLISERVAMNSGSLRQQDDIYLCTDAVAAWFLREVEHGGRPWETLRDLGTSDGPNFADFIGEERASGHMRNDDATLIHVAVW
ncbi:hypothetical protein [Sphaerisporangium perillae]|uniref:hypothetical protein n=1 Tax=Sphaerisporangium perillae TaxID=2935860 RepID=UPI00200DB01B|nr:hypothetical protein [Sphaerisporangium perillae]